MLERTTRLVSENLARVMDRRKFLRRASEAAFAGVATVAAGHVLSPGASAALDPSAKKVPTVPSCAPPGPYCNLNGINEPNGCHGGSCFQHMNSNIVYQCRVYYQFYAAGCWTTVASGGYWTCCDCECGNWPAGPRVATCGCAQFSAGPVPRPDSKDGG